MILVDGNSKDNTIEAARHAYPDIRVTSQSGRGKGDAFRTGFAAVTGNLVVMLDADGSADPAEIPRFVDALEAGADFAKGSRYMDGGGSADITRLRSLGNPSSAAPPTCSTAPSSPTSATATTPSGPAASPSSRSTSPASRSRP